MALSELVLPALSLVAGGVAMGLAAGMLGIGGGGILVPLLYEVFGAVGVADDVRMHLSVGTSLAVIVPTSLSSIRAHFGRGAVDTDIVRSLALAVMLGVGLGILVAKFAKADVLKIIWVCSATAMSIKLFLGRESWRLGDVIPGQPFRAIYGVFIGAVSTLMSIGGGVFITALMTLYGRPIHQAVGTAAAFGPLVAIPGSIGFAWAGWHAAGLPAGSVGYVSLIAAGIIAPVSVIAAPYGARLAHAISKRKLELAFATFLALVGLRFIFTLL